MSRSDSNLQRLVHRVRRRLVLLRIAEAGGIGLLAASLFAMVLAGLLLWLGRPAMPAALGLLVVGTTCGMAVGFAGRPSGLQAAVRADQRLRLHDLLSTAYACAKAPSSFEAEPWRHSVLAMAEARCATLNPSAVLVRTLDSRAWSGIALAAMLALTLAAFSTASQQAAATVPRRGTGLLPAFAGPSAPREAGPPLVSASSPRVIRRTWADPQERDPKDRGASSADDGLADPDDRAAASATNAAANSGASSGASSPNSTGTGQSQGGRTIRNVDATPASGTTGTASQPGGDATAGGAGTSSPGGTFRPGPVGEGTAGPSQAMGQASPWDGATWATDVRNAREVVNSGRVPEASRAIVRDYFERK